MAKAKPTETVIEQVTADDLDNLLGMPGAEAVMVPGEEPAPAAAPAEPDKPTFFQKEKVDMEFLDPNPPADPPELSEEEKAKAEAEAAAAAEEPPAEPKPADPTSFEAIIDEAEEDLDEQGNPKKGRPALDKSGMAQLAQTLIDENMILPFEGEEKKLEDYTMDDYKELFKMNFDNQREQIKQETPKEFFESLPQELQYAAKYVADGGQDMKGLFSALAAAEESKSMSLDTPEGQEQAAKQFLQASNFGTPEEIQEQIDSWKDLGKLEDKAAQFKPRLDAMQEQIVQRKVKEQEAKKAQREQQSRQYADSIYDTLEKGKLGDLTINNKVQNMLYQGLIQPNYQSVTGQPTNLFGHLIEKHQYVEPNHGLISEALWLLADPEGYRAEIKKTATNEAVADAARKLKIEQSNKNAGSGAEPEPGAGKGPAKGIKRAPKNFFKR